MFGLEEMADDQEVFTQIKYRKKTDVNITYSILYRVFAKIIRPMLDQYLVEIKNFLCDIGCSIDDEKNDVKVAIVGGFGQFPLVQHAVWEIFGCSDTARDITLDASGGRRDAISFGAALIAAGKITVPVRSRYAIGLRIYNNDRRTFRNAIHYGELIPDSTKIYPLGHKKGARVEKDRWEPIIFTNASNHVPWMRSSCWWWSARACWRASCCTT